MDLAEATQCDLPPRLRRLVGLLGQHPTRRDRRPLKHGPPTGIIVLLIGISEVYSLAAAEDSLSTTRSDRSPRRRVLLHRAQGPVDVLVNNAGIERTGAIEETPLVHFRTCMVDELFRSDSVHAGRDTAHA